MHKFVYVSVLWIFFPENAFGDGPKNSRIRVKGTIFSEILDFVSVAICRLFLDVSHTNHTVRTILYGRYSTVHIQLETKMIT